VDVDVAGQPQQVLDDQSTQRLVQPPWRKRPMMMLPTFLSWPTWISALAKHSVNRQRVSPVCAAFVAACAAATSVKRNFDVLLSELPHLLTSF
jgi:hypothetical protein